MTLDEQIARANQTIDVMGSAIAEFLNFATASGLARDIQKSPGNLEFAELGIALLEASKYVEATVKDKRHDT